MLIHEKTTSDILGAAIEVHRTLGPGLLESVYTECFCSEAEARGLTLERQRIVPLTYKGRELASCLRVDLIVSDAVVVEMKSIEALTPVHTSQLLTYLRLTGLRVGILINWNVHRLMDGVVRRVL
jgi:GxxExxY protein